VQVEELYREKWPGPHGIQLKEPTPARSVQKPALQVHAAIEMLPFGEEEPLGHGEQTAREDRPRFVSGEGYWESYVPAGHSRQDSLAELSE
jgi:hypothetical protein